jgi:hypothetical protein
MLGTVNSTAGLAASAAAYASSRLHSDTIARPLEDGVGQVYPTPEYLAAAKTNFTRSVVPAISIASDPHVQKTWLPGIPLFIDKQSGRGDAPAIVKDGPSLCSMMYAASVLAAEEGSGDTRKRTRDADDIEFFSTVEKFADKWRFAGWHAGPPNPYPRTGPSVANYADLGEQPITLPIAMSGMTMVMNWGNKRVLEPFDELWLVRKKVSLSQVNPPSSSGGRLLHGARIMNPDVRCMVMFIVASSDGAPKTISFDEEIECLKNRTDPSFNSGSYLDFEKAMKLDSNGKYIPDLDANNLPRFTPVIRNAHVTKLGHVLHRTASKLEYPSEGSRQLKCDMLSLETAKDAGAPMFLCAPFGGYRGEF